VRRSAAKIAEVTRSRELSYEAVIRKHIGVISRNGNFSTLRRRRGTWRKKWRSRIPLEHILQVVGQLDPRNSPAYAAFLFKAEQKPFSGRIIVFDLQVHDGADPGERVGKDPKQSAITEARVRGCLDRVKKPLNFAFNKCRRFAFGPRKSLGLDFPGRIHGENSFFGEPGKQHPDSGHVLFDRGRRGPELQRLDIRRDRDGLIKGGYDGL